MQDLVSVNPKLALEWNFVKNGELSPGNISVWSQRKVWWTCEKGHEWEARINKRSQGQNCPYCAGKKVLKGVNDLATKNPELVKEWNYKRNGNKKPEDFFPCSQNKVWWICEKGHEWETLIVSRRNGTKCPYCMGQKAIKGVNDLTTKNPKLVKEWNYKKNKNKRPENYLPDSKIKVWWICEKGHEWEAQITNRNRGTGCPYCAGKKVIKGENDLVTKNPKLAKQWNYSRNGKKRPEDYMPNAMIKVWWICEKGHEWKTAINHRNNWRNCPYCSGKKVIKGENDLTTINSELSKEWNYSKNGEKKPEDYMSNAMIKVWWICEKGHEWKASINNRNKGTKCPCCARIKI